MILTIDCGSTNLKAALFDERLERVAEESIPLAYTVKEVDRVEFDPEAFWTALKTILGRLPSKNPIATVALTSQAQTFTVVDASGGKPVTPFYSWLDKRAEAECEDIKKRLGKDFHQHCSFSPPLPQLQISKVLWLKRNQKGVIAKGRRIVLLPEFAAMRLAGVSALDRNLAAMGGLYSLTGKCWWKEALEFCGLQASQLAELVDVGAGVSSRRAASAADLPLAQDVRVVFAGNDQTSGAFGTIGETGGIVLTLGTALVVYRYAGTKPGPFTKGVCWGPYPGNGYYELAFRDEGCGALDWARGKMDPGTDAGAFLAKGWNAAPGSAFFFPQRTGKDGAWAGSEDKAARTLAVVEGISFCARQLLVEELGLKLGEKPITVIGGGAKNPKWLQLLADILHCKTQRGKGDNLLGSALLAAGRGLGAAAGQAVGEAFNPDPARMAAYDAAYAKWRVQV